MQTLASTHIQQEYCGRVGVSFKAKGFFFEQIDQIPYGETRSYKDIARAIGKPKSYRAVANACGKNLIPIVFDLRRTVDMDFSTASLIRSLAKSIKERDGRHVLFFGASQTIEDVLQGVDAALFHSYSTIHEVEDKLIHG